MTSDPRSGDPFVPAGPDDATTAHPTTTPSPSPWAPASAGTPAGQPRGTAAQMSSASGDAAPGGPSVPPTSMPPISAAPAGDPFDRSPAALPVERAAGRGRGGGMLVNILLGIALVVAVGGVAFAVGRATAPATAANGRTFPNGQGGFLGGPNASGAPGGTFNGGLGGAGVSIEGTVTAVSADSITIQLASGQSITIPTDASTTYHERSAATAAAVTSGSAVIVQLEGGRGAFGQGNGGNGNGGPNASGAPGGRTVGTASSITVVPAGG